jgi:type IV pilus assembly protein PilF
MTSTLARCLALLGAALCLAACKHTPDEKDRRSAEIHNDLAVGSLNQGDFQSAYAEFQEAVKIDDTLADAHNGLGLVLHLNYQKFPDAEKEYKRALELRPAFPEAHVNLGNLYLDQGRYDEAIVQYEAALNDMLYRTPHFAQSNLGWALYKKGQTDKAIESVRAAVTSVPNFCQGWKTLGLIYDGTGKAEKACDAFGEFAQSCPTVAEAHQLLGVCRAKLGRTDLARSSFTTCIEHASAGTVHEDCQSFLTRLGGPLPPPPQPHPAPPAPAKP